MVKEKAFFFINSSLARLRYGARHAPCTRNHQAGIFRYVLQGGMRPQAQAIRPSVDGAGNSVSRLSQSLPYRQRYGIRLTTSPGIQLAWWHRPNPGGFISTCRCQIIFRVGDGLNTAGLNFACLSRETFDFVSKFDLIFRAAALRALRSRFADELGDSANGRRQSSRYAEFCDTFRTRESGD
jgi:hypothetical protein